ncbi:Nucleotide-binding universal stress protein, UspA family [Friedmanniella luteola]|uniref:Nucleotide-binding universal stress protein, UspA family n=1 Tax=Friedmanniella luteola TaxID=546871 RepID=A0A1H1VH31_9ACTN|nr:universal stress protein [Friedmanniella luteola]SDS84158.1 Nucleotide-binding universal stress protein, UspA family [Friedmanniella luteola]
MTILVALAPGERGSSALDLGAVLARSAGEDVVVVTVVPTPWPPSPYRVDAEFQALQERSAQEVLDQARTRMGDDLAVEYRVRRDRSVPAGLLEVAQQVGAAQVVLGSSASSGYGRVSLGGVADRLLHSSEVPVALAPAGYVARDGTRVRRVTVAFGRSDGDTDLLRTAAGVADRIGATLRVACFAVHPVNVFSGAVPGGADALVAGEWRRVLQDDVDRALRAGAVATRVETVVGQGDSWPGALTDVPWAEGDVLAIGTSSSAISRFFLGSHASKIVRSSPVPVVLTARG